MSAKPRGVNAVLLVLMLALVLGLFLLLFLSLLTGGVGQRNDSSSLVLYCAQDQVFAERALEEFHRRTGLKVRAVFDSEAVKTVGMANRLLAEAKDPVAHVFWGNEELRTRQLAERGVFGTNQILPGGPGWAAFGARTRRLVIDPSRLGASERPVSLVELTNARWKGKLSLAVPLFGTTSTHFHVLRARWGEEAWRRWCSALAANEPFLEPGNSHVVRRVARGEALVGLTDSDDIFVARREGVRVEGLTLEEDLLVVPNTVALVRPAAPGDPARRLVDFLMSAEVAALLVREGALESTSVPQGRWLAPDWTRVLRDLDVTVGEIEGIFRK